MHDILRIGIVWGIEAADCQRYQDASTTARKKDLTTFLYSISCPIKFIFYLCKRSSDRNVSVKI
jgi:hypothetical protein